MVAENHSQIIEDYVKLLTKYTVGRLKSFFSEEEAPPHISEDFDLPFLRKVLSAYLNHPVSREELPPRGQFLILLGLAPHLEPNYFDEIIQHALPKAGDFPQLGGTRGNQYRGFLPTGETAVFLLTDQEIYNRFSVEELFSPGNLLTRRRVLWLEEVPEGEPRMSGKIVLAQEFVELFTQGRITPPGFSMRFPAQLLETEMEWSDLVLNERTWRHIRELETWIKHGKTLLTDWGMSKRLKPGYRALFYGPPGTGKTLTASLLGKYTRKPVYRVDLSMVVSKFIGETEKNLANLFAKAENKDWILFFDEADALFGKRTDIRDAHDKYANQEVAYLLQRVEGYNGLVILASNFKTNIDDAFIRRFQSVVHFPLPKPGERLRLWQQSFPHTVHLAPNVDLEHVAHRFELSGSGIINVVQYCCLEALERGDARITNEDIVRGIQKEYEKEGRLA